MTQRLLVGRSHVLCIALRRMILRDVSQEKPKEREHRREDEDGDDSAHHAFSPSEVDDLDAAALLPGIPGAGPGNFSECRIVKALTARPATVCLPSQHAMEPVPPA
jgi:hypothetical protein